MRIIFLILFISLSFFTKLSIAQASGSTDFSFEIQLLTETTVDDYDFFILSNDNGISHFSKCFISKDTLTNNVIISGHMSYIVGGDVLSLIISQKGVLEAEKYRQRFETRKNHYLNIGRVAWVKDSVKVIQLDEKKPIIEISGQFNDKKEYMVQTRYFEFPETNNQREQFAVLFLQEWCKVPVI